MWCGAALWGVGLGCRSSGLEPQLYPESGALHPSGSFDKCLGPPDAKWGISPGAHLWVVPSADMAVLTTYMNILDVSPCQTCLL